MTFSILIPAYKAAFLKETIDSILSQRYNSFEVVLVNDSSPEDIDSIVKQYNDERIKYYENEKNIGAVELVDNWNKCLEYAKGDYVICMGDDDKLLPNCLEEYKKLIDQYPGIGLLHGWTVLIDENAEPFQMTTMRGSHESAYSLCWHRIMGYYSHQFVGDFCYERKWLVENGGFYKIPLAWGSDDITALIGAGKNGVANTQVPVFQYRSNRYSVSSTGNIEIKVDAINQTLDWYKQFLNTKSDNQIDELFRVDSLNNIDHLFNKKKGITIASDLDAEGIFRILYWIKNRRKYRVTANTIVYALINHIKGDRK